MLSRAIYLTLVAISQATTHNRLYLAILGCDIISTERLI
jgi:hypothetical protein